jgi:tetratricopeptide (TPR) repeat protein
LVTNTTTAPIEQAFRAMLSGLSEKLPDSPTHASLLRLASDAGGFRELAERYESLLWQLAPGPERVLAHRRLARIYRRKLGDLEGALRHCYGVLAEAPADQRALGALEQMLGRANRWEELDAALGKAFEPSIKSNPARAAALARRRARIAAERMRDPAVAARRFHEAAELADRLDPRLGVAVRAEAVRVLAAARADRSTIAAAAGELLQASRIAGSGAAGAAAAARIAAALGSRGAGLLMELADAAVRRGDQVEAAAHLRSAVDLQPENDELAQRLESLFVARSAWRELADFYRERIGRVADTGARAELMVRLAELLEDELGDRVGAAQAYGAALQLTGDPAVAQAQCRLLAAEGDLDGVAQALDTAVEVAADLPARCLALLARADFLRQHQESGARADYKRAAVLDPGSVRALCGLAELAPEEGCAEAVQALDQALRALAPGSPDRADGLRRLAILQENRLGNAEAAARAWEQVLRERPGDREAFDGACTHARATGDAARLVDLLRDALTRSPPGEAARRWRHEMAETLQQAGNDAQALEAWTAAARADPGDRRALLALADLLEKRGRHLEAAKTLEDAVMATEDRVQKGKLCDRLAGLYRGPLADPERAAVFERKARAFAPPEPLPDTDRLSALTPLPQAIGGWSDATLRARLKQDPFDVTANNTLFAEAVESKQLDRAFVHAALLQTVGRASPRERAFYEERAARPPASPRLALSARERAGLFPRVAPLAAELYSVAGVDLAAVHAIPGLAAGCSRYFTVAADPRHEAMADALFVAARFLGRHPPEIYVGATRGVPVDFRNTEPPRLVVAPQAIQPGRRPSPAVLRFSAGRAMAALEAEALPLLGLPRGTLTTILEGLMAVSLPPLSRPREVLQVARALERRIPEARLGRLVELAGEAYRTLVEVPVDSLVEAAEDGVNRCGLVLCGDPCAAIDALRDAGVTRRQLVSLAQYAVDDSYFSLRQRLGLAEG